MDVIQLVQINIFKGNAYKTHLDIPYFEDGSGVQKKLQLLKTNSSIYPIMQHV